MANPVSDLDRDLDVDPEPGRGLGREAPPGTPRWVKAFGIAFLVLVLLIVTMIAGGHGPGRHMTGGGHMAPSGVTQRGEQHP